MSKKPKMVPLRPAAVGPQEPARSAMWLALVAEVDALFRRHERAWGVGRVYQGLGAEDLLRWRSGLKLWRDAVNAGDLGAMQALISKLARGVAALEAKAAQRGLEPLAVGVWEATLPDGTTLQVVKTPAEALALSENKDERQREIWTLDEIARVLQQYTNVNEIKRAFPGSFVRKLTQRDESFVSDFVNDDPLLELFHNEELGETEDA